MVTEEVMKWVKEWVAGWSNRQFFSRSSHQQTSKGTASSGYPLVLDRAGKVDASFYDADDVVLTTGAQTVAGVKTFSDDIVANSGTIRSPNTATVRLIAGTSASEGPYVQLYGKDVGGASDGVVELVSTTESSALGGFQFFNYNGSTYAQIAALDASGNFQADGTLSIGSSSSIYAQQKQAGVTITNSTWTSVLTGLTGVSIVLSHFNNNATNYGGVFYVINNAGTITIAPISVTNMVAGAPAGFQIGYQASGTALQMQAGPSWSATIGCNVAAFRLVW